MKKENIQKFFANKTVRTVLILLVALLLVFAVYRVFFKKGESDAGGVYEATALEERLSRILSGIDGVGNTKVLVSEENGKAVSAVFVFEGADSILTRMRVIDAASIALGIGKEFILVYPAES